MISNRFIKKVPKISQLEDKYSATVYDSKMPFFCSQEGVKVFDLFEKLLEKMV